jgi:hypothetical protein
MDAVLADLDMAGMSGHVDYGCLPGSGTLLSTTGGAQFNCNAVAAAAAAAAQHYQQHVLPATTAQHEHASTSSMQFTDL